MLTNQNLNTNLIIKVVKKKRKGEMLSQIFMNMESKVVSLTS